MQGTQDSLHFYRQLRQQQSENTKKLVEAKKDLDDLKSSHSPYNRADTIRSAAYHSSIDYRTSVNDYFERLSRYKEAQETDAVIRRAFERKRLKGVITESLPINRGLERIDHDIKEVQAEVMSLNQRINNARSTHSCGLLTSKLIKELEVYTELVKERFEMLSQRDRLHPPRSRYADMPWDFFTESGEMNTGSIDPSTTTTTGNVSDVSGDRVDSTTTGNVQNSTILNRTTLNPDKFFERPIEILATTIPLNTDVTIQIPVWQEYFLDPTVRAKLRNYGFIRCNMNVQVTVSAMPFHYGRLQAGYVPCPLTVDTYQWYLTHMSTQRQNYLKYISQTPGTKNIDVKENNIMEFKFPYVSPQPMLRLFNNASTVLSDTTPLSDTQNMGDFVFNTLNQLNTATTDTTSVVSVFIRAWITEVELGCPTAYISTITTESDERKTGPVQKIATSASKIAKALTAVPFIAPFAKPSEMILSGIASFAAIFGWSYPTVIERPIRMKNEPFQNPVQLIGNDTGHRLTLDPKQELTVDPRITGIEHDELSIAYLTNIESLLDTFTWDPDDVALETPLWTTMVAPDCNVPITISGRNHVQPTAMHFATQPFCEWRGKIKYKIEIIASQFHRGKFAVIYEPAIPQAVLMNASLQLNKQFVQMIDIEQTQEFEFEVDWAFPKHWAQMMSDADKITSVNQFTNLPDKFKCCNGYITIVPITTLQSPNDSNVFVNVYVSSSDMMVNRVTASRLPTSRLYTESYETKNQREAISTMQLNPTGSSTDGIVQLHFGEQPISFRSLLKRFATTRDFNQGGISVQWGIQYKGPVVPDLLPSFSNDTDNPTLLGYLRYAFLAMRGGLRKRIKFYGADYINSNQVKVTLLPPSDVTQTPSISTYDHPDCKSMLDGTTTFVPFTNNGVEFEIPFYTNNLFVYSSYTLTYPSFDTTFEQVMDRNYLVQYDNTNANSDFIFNEETATAEDFTLMRYLGAPPYAFNS